MRKTTPRFMRAAMNQAPVETSRGFGRRTGAHREQVRGDRRAGGSEVAWAESSQRQVCSRQCSNVWSMGRGDTPKAVHWEGAQVALPEPV